MITSYFVIVFVISQLILHDHVTHLLYLVGFCQVVSWLQDQNLIDIVSGEDMMATFDSQIKTQRLQ